MMKCRQTEKNLIKQSDKKIKQTHKNRFVRLGLFRHS